ncbi:hypothetical protein ABBQ32_012277 [Trebouxia sp. C0010 RCD-2024]
MFWRVPSYSQASPLEGILDKQQFTLEELLDEEDLIQECKALNARLLNFLLQPSTIEQLITYLTVQSPLPPGLDEAEVQKRWSKFPFAACEVFCCEVETLFNTLLGSEHLMGKLFSIVDTQQLPDITLAGYFARVVKVLLVKRNQDMMDYLHKHRQTLTQLANHLETTSIAEVVVFVVGAAEFSSNYTTVESLEWLKETNLTQEILDQVRGSQARDAQKNAAAVLAAIARSQISPLLSNMSNASFLDQLTQYAFHSEAQVSCQALDVCIALLSPKQAMPDSFASPGESGTPTSPTSPPADSEADRHLKEVTIDSILLYMKSISSSLDVPDTGRVLETPFGVLQPPLGSLRLKLVELLSAMLRLGNSAAESSIIAAEAPQKALSLLLRFPFNNLLHTQVTSLVLHALDSGTPTLVEHLFEGCDLLGWISQAPQQVQPTPREGDAHIAQRQPIRAGYLGHLVLLGNSLVEASSRRQDIQTALQASPQWEQYANGPLAEANTRQDVMQWACGRPSKEALSTFKSTDDIIIDETDAPEEGSVNRHLMRYSSMEDDDVEGSLPMDKDFSDAADALGSLNLSEGWSSLSLRSRHSESGAQDSQLRAERGDPFQSSTDREGNVGEDEEPYSSPQNGQHQDDQTTQVTLDVSHFLSKHLQSDSPPPEDAGIDDDVVVMTEDFDDLMDEDAVVLPNAHYTSDNRSNGDSSWAAFDDLAAQRSSRLDSEEPAQQPEAESNPFGQQANASTDSSEAEGGWAAFAADPPAFPSVDSASGEDLPAFRTDTPERQSDSHQPDPNAEASSGHSWAAFDDPDASQGQHTAADTSPSQSSEQHGKALSGDQLAKSPQSEFGENNFWRTHPLAFVDNVE